MIMSFDTFKPSLNFLPARVKTERNQIDRFNIYLSRQNHAQEDPDPELEGFNA